MCFIPVKLDGPNCTICKCNDGKAFELAPATVTAEREVDGVYLNGDRSPGNLYVYDFASKKATKLTDSLNPEINPADLVNSQVVRYKSFDGVQVPSILYKPKQASAQNK